MKEYRGIRIVNVKSFTDDEIREAIDGWLMYNRMKPDQKYKMTEWEDWHGKSESYKEFYGKHVSADIYVEGWPFSLSTDLLRKKVS